MKKWTSLDNSLLLIMCYMFYVYYTIKYPTEQSSRDVVDVVGGGGGTSRRRDSAKCCWMFNNLLKLSVYLGIQCFDISPWYASFRGQKRKDFCYWRKKFPFFIISIIVVVQWVFVFFVFICFIWVLFALNLC